MSEYEENQEYLLTESNPFLKQSLKMADLQTPQHEQNDYFTYEQDYEEQGESRSPESITNMKQQRMSSQNPLTLGVLSKGELSDLTISPDKQTEKPRYRDSVVEQLKHF